MAEFQFAVTTTGRAVIAACMAREKPLRITRVAFGSGELPDGIALADVHELYNYVADGSIADRRHDGETVSLTAQYVNGEHPGVPTFYLSEFIVYAEDPETGENADLIYANLGDYKQAVPAWSEGMPDSAFTYPLTTVLSSELSVSIVNPGGLVTYNELVQLLDASGIGTSVHDVTIPVSGWSADADATGYALMRDVTFDECERCTERMKPNLSVLPSGMGAAANAELATFVRSLDGKIRVYANRAPESAIPANLELTGMLPYIRITEEITDTLPPASANSVGGIKASNTLRVDPDGTAHVDLTPFIATDAEATEAIDEVFNN